MLSSRQRRAELDAVLEIARDLSASLHSDNRYGRLLAAICRVIPCDAACLLKLDGHTLEPLAARGLSGAALSQVYPRDQHPRLATLVDSLEPVRFPPDSKLPDPFDGLVAGPSHELGKVHDCMGCALTERDEVVGVLTLDAFKPGAFENVDRQLLATLAALAGASLRTIALVDALEAKAERQHGVAREIGRRQRIGLVGQSSAIARVRRDIEIVAPSDVPVLVTGETGVGKEVVASLVHASSRRSSEPLVHVNCAALPETLADSELFGHVAGAFTGAFKSRPGKFEAADNGTLFLDEVGELPLSVQAKLLVALQSGVIQRVGSDTSRRVDVRVIAATNRTLEREVSAGRFREDLLHRLTAFTIELPPLRERADDIAELLTDLLIRARRRLGTGPVEVAPSAVTWIGRQPWPGNVRELQNALTRALLRAAHEHEQRRPERAGGRGKPLRLELHHFDASARADAASPDRTQADDDSRPLRDRVSQFQRQEVQRALAHNNGSIAAAARDLGMHRSNLHHLMERLGLQA